MLLSELLTPAQLVGYVALVLGVAAFLQRCDTRLKVLIAAESIAYVVHFILLANTSSAAPSAARCWKP